MTAIRREKVSPTADEREQFKEIENKQRSCNNASYSCSLNRVDGFEYCFRHILQDTGGHFKQCAFTYSNGKKCRTALPSYDYNKDPTLTSYCFEHSRQISKTCSSVGRYVHVDTNDVLLNNLSHNLQVEEKKKTANRQNCQDDEIDVESPHEEIFIGYKNVHDIDPKAESKPKRRRILDYASDTSDEIEPPTLRNTANCVEFENSDAESIDSTEEDLLKHAEIYTRQEILRMSEAKLTKLQSLYIEQINQLHHLLKDRRRKYLLALRKEREILCSIHDQLKETPKERKLYKQLKAYNTYHQKSGVEAVLQKKLKEKRAKIGDTYGGYKPHSFTKCHFAEGGVKCMSRALPCCKFCRKHILEEKKQTLFRPCSVDSGVGVPCATAIPCIFDDSTCVLHMPLPMKKHYLQKKNESETEEEDTLGSNADFGIKQETDEIDVKPTDVDKELISLSKEKAK